MQSQGEQFAFCYKERGWMEAVASARRKAGLPDSLSYMMNGSLFAMVNTVSVYFVAYGKIKAGSEAGFAWRMQCTHSHLSSDLRIWDKTERYFFTQFSKSTQMKPVPRWKFLWIPGQQDFTLSGMMAMSTPTRSTSGHALEASFMNVDTSVSRLYL